MNAFGERLVERVGPIVVKEVRQGLRAKVFTIFFSLLLVLCLAIALVAVAQASGGGGDTYGRQYFAAYLLALGSICFFVIPFVAFRSMLRELEDETWVLLTLTGLGSRNITHGKWVSAMSQSVLFASACAPFVLFSYFLNGVDILQLLSSLVLAFSWSAVLTAVAIGIATQGHTRMGRTLSQFFVLGTLAAGSMLGAGVFMVLAMEGSRSGNQDIFRNLVFGVSTLGAAVTWMVLEGAAASLALPTESMSHRPRVALLTVIGLALVFIVSVFFISSGRGKDVGIAAICLGFFLVVVGVFCISERDGFPARTLDEGWSRPGAFRSFAVIQLLLIASLVLLLSLASMNWGGSEERIMSTIGAAMAYPSMYLSLGVLIGRLTPLHKLGEPRATRIGFIVGTAVGIIGSTLAAAVFARRPDDRDWNTLNPFIGMVNFSSWGNGSFGPRFVALMMVTVVTGFFAGAVLAHRDGARG